MVAARETTLQELLEGSKQYQVPLYQRTYSWTKTQLQRLWEDVTKLAQDRAEDSTATHFIGSLVLAPSPANGPTGVQEFLVVDGQQRLTTLSILLCAIRDHRATREDAEHRDRINQQYLINKWKPGQQRLKLVPTQDDRAAYVACLDSTPQAGGSDPVGAAYRFFSAQLFTADDPDDETDIERIEDAVISGLSVVSVTAQRGDNAHRIFESLNNTGLRLTQGDLLRNYLFMRLPTRGDAVYQSLWLPLQQQLTSSELEVLFWLDLVRRDARIKQTDTYARQQALLDHIQGEENIEAEVARLGRLGALFKRILDPTTEDDSEVQRRLERLNQWGTTTVYPLLLDLLDRRDRGDATSEQIARAMLYVESFFVRRLIIGRATSNINRILLSVLAEMRGDLPVDEAVRAYLSTGRKFFANDAELRTGVATIPFYLNGRPHQRALVLRWLEQSLGSKEPVGLGTLTIEHVLPQTPTSEWRQMLDADLGPDEQFLEVHESLVHTLGNLTLTGYNSAMSNNSFAVKREQLATSGVLMNQEIAHQHRWGRPEILARAATIADRVISLWPAPIKVDSGSGSGTAWDVMDRALAELPAGAWTTYGDVAALIGSHSVAIGKRLATVAVPNGHRVLRAEGTVSPGFVWSDTTRHDDPHDTLAKEGVEFDDHRRANPAQRVSTDELAQLAGIDADDLPERLPNLATGQTESLRDRFVEQLTDMRELTVVHGVLELLNAWVALGGTLVYGNSPSETSCFLITEAMGGPSRTIWPVVLYPSGKVEVVFQHLRARPPFDQLGLREELRQRLNTVPGVDLPSAKIELRPGFPMDVLGDRERRRSVIDTLTWFYDQTQLDRQRHRSTLR